MQNEIRLVLRPRRTYNELLLAAEAGTWLRVAARAGLVLLIIAASLAIAATRVFSIRLLLSLAVCWGFVIVVQLGLASALIASARERTVTMRRALELWFMGHAPWSLLLILLALSTYIAYPGDPTNLFVGGIVILVIALRLVMVFAYCVEILRSSTKRALVQTISHQAAVLLLMFLHAAWAVDAWARFSA